MLSSTPNDHQRQQRAEARGRQAREDGERMDEALVQDAEHEVDHDDRRAAAGCPCPAASPGTPAPCPEKVPVSVAGTCSVAHRRLHLGDRLRQRDAGRRSKEKVTEGSCPRCVDLQRADAVRELRHRIERHERAGRASARRAAAAPRIGLVARRELEDHEVLVGGGVDGRHLPRAVGVVERHLDRSAPRRRAPRPSRARSPPSPRARDLQVARDVDRARAACAASAR